MSDQPYSHSDFVRLALAEFPELRSEFEDELNLLHLQMHAFTRLMQRAKREGDWKTYSRGVRLAAELWRRPNDALLNAHNVSFLEHLDYDGPNGPAAWEKLTSELQVGWEAMRAYNERLLATPRKARGKRR